MDDPQTIQGELDEQEQELRRQQTHLQAQTTQPHTPQNSGNGSVPSEMRALLDLLEAQSARIETMGRTLQAESDRSAKLQTEQLETMRLMQLMIVEFDKKIVTMGDQVERLETIAAALVRVQANLSEIVAALVGPPPEKG